MSTFTACASRSWFTQTRSNLPIEAIRSGNGTILSFRAVETRERLYVSGMTRPYRISQDTHVDIQLIGRSGQIIDERMEDIESRRFAHTRGHSQTYMASFPLNEARQASKIRVLYHDGAHPEQMTQS